MSLAPIAPSLERRLCSWCRQEQLNHPSAKFCSKRCRQTAFRLRRRSGTAVVASSSEPHGVFAYADPPYPGFARRLYGCAEVDHRILIASLTDRGYTGWALSTSEKSLREILPLCPPGARVCPWIKPIGVSSRTYGLHNAWEPLIVVGGRKRRPGFRDWLSAQPARGWGKLIGRKPLAFCAFLFRCLGMIPGDGLIDLYPGTGMVSRSWEELCRTSTSDGKVV